MGEPVIPRRVWNARCVTDDRKFTFDSRYFGIHFPTGPRSRKISSHEISNTSNLLRMDAPYIFFLHQLIFVFVDLNALLQNYERQQKHVPTYPKVCLVFCSSPIVNIRHISWTHPDSARQINIFISLI